MFFPQEAGWWFEAWPVSTHDAWERGCVSYVGLNAATTVWPLKDGKPTEKEVSRLLSLFFARSVPFFTLPCSSSHILCHPLCLFGQRFGLAMWRVFIKELVTSVHHKNEDLLCCGFGVVQLKGAALTSMCFV